MKIVPTLQGADNPAHEMAAILDVLEKLNLLIQEPITAESVTQLLPPESWEAMSGLGASNRIGYCIGLSVEDIKLPQINVLRWIPPQNDGIRMETDISREVPGYWVVDTTNRNRMRSDYNVRYCVAANS
jgi:hypothetical protein